MDKIGLNNIAYVDTDSIITNSVGRDILDAHRHESKLGYWKFEGESKNLVIRGLKDYTFDGVDTVKGIPKSAMHVSGNDYFYESIGSFRNSKFGKADNRSDIICTLKTLKRQYEKAVLCESCGYHPFHDVKFEHLLTDSTLAKN